MRTHSLPALALLSAALAGASSLSAQDVKFGLQAGAAFPSSDLGDLVDNKAGFTVGGFAVFDLKNGHAIRPRLDYAHFQGSQGGAGTIDMDGTSVNVAGNVTVKADTISAGADYLYYFEREIRKGFYVLGGLGVSYNKISVDASGTVSSGGVTVPASLSTSANSTQPYGNVGVGYQFSPNFGLEARFNVTQYKNNNTESRASDWDSAIVAATFRF
jgi:hypothetical protein